MSFDPDKITYFAKTDARGQDVQFGIKARDRQRHMYVIGKTGMGKSTLLENMAAQDIQNGEGMAFIDPHGAAAEVLLEYVPEHRIKDVIYFAPFDTANPIAFNVMEDVGVDKRHLVVSGLMSTFKKIWVDAWSARMEYILTNALLALIEYPDSTLISVNRLFSDKEYRKLVVDNITDPAVKSFWVDEFANYTERFAAEALPAIQNKIGQFTGNPLIRNIIGQPKSSFDIREIMDKKKILIMNLSKGLVGDTNTSLLGSMLTTRIYLAAMSRADLPPAIMKTMPNFYFYVDEFQSFSNSTFADILSEARKYHLNLIIAHQYIEQMEEEVRDAVFGNVGTTVSFRVGPFDAETLETVYTPTFLAADLVNLGFAQIYLTLMIDGIGSKPFSAKTLPPIEPPQVSYKEMVIAESRKNYTGVREDIEKLVTELHEPVRKAPPPNKNQNNSGPRPPHQGGQNNQGKPGGPNNSGGNNAGDTSRPPQQQSNRPPQKGGSNDRAPQSAARTTNDQSQQSRQNNNRPPQNKPPTKDLSELRSVLKGMTGTQPENTVQEKTESKFESAKKSEVRDTQNEQKPERKPPQPIRSETQPNNKPPGQESKNTNPKADLKDALKGVLGNTGDAAPYTKPEQVERATKVGQTPTPPPVQQPRPKQQPEIPRLKPQQRQPRPAVQTQAPQAAHTAPQQKTIPEVPRQTVRPSQPKQRVQEEPRPILQKEVAPVSAPQQQSTPVVQQSRGDDETSGSISVKDLERMMRVTTSDKPPLK